MYAVFNILYSEIINNLAFKAVKMTMVNIHFTISAVSPTGNIEYIWFHISISEPSTKIRIKSLQRQTKSHCDKNVKLISFLWFLV